MPTNPLANARTAVLQVEQSIQTAIIPFFQPLDLMAPPGPATLFVRMTNRQPLGLGKMSQGAPSTTIARVKEQVSRTAAGVGATRRGI